MPASLVLLSRAADGGSGDRPPRASSLSASAEHEAVAATEGKGGGRDVRSEAGGVGLNSMRPGEASLVSTGLEDYVIVQCASLDDFMEVSDT